MLSLYANIKKRRVSMKMTQDELAKLAGYKDRSIITLIENGKIDLPQSKIWAIADALKTTPAELMGDDGTTEEKQITIGLDFGTSYSSTFKFNHLLAYMAALNGEGLEKLEKYAEDLSQIEKYKK